MIEVSVDAGDRSDLAPRLADAVEVTLRRCGVEEAEVSVALLDDERMRTMNREHLDHDWTTDVLSFALWDEGEPILGDVYIGLEQAPRQAAEAGAGPTEEFVRLAVHGTLHVLGYDHPDDAVGRAASEMYRLQEEIVTELGKGAE